MQTLDNDLVFEGRSFCFTGGLSDLTRSKAESETRARGGLTSKKTVNKKIWIIWLLVLNQQLDGSMETMGLRFRKL